MCIFIIMEIKMKYGYYKINLEYLGNQMDTNL
jgi:hypothetical protein